MYAMMYEYGGMYASVTRMLRVENHERKWGGDEYTHTPGTTEHLSASIIMGILLLYGNSRATPNRIDQTRIPSEFSWTKT